MSTSAAQKINAYSFKLTGLLLCCKSKGYPDFFEKSKYSSFDYVNQIFDIFQIPKFDTNYYYLPSNQRT